MAGTMNPEVKAQWVADLRSETEYTEQTRGRLRRVDGFCCLGVLTDRGVRSGVDCPVLESGKSFYYGKDNNSGILPREIQEWAGLSDYDPVVIYKNVSRQLSELNDTEKLTFAEIADIIEDQL